MGCDLEPLSIAGRPLWRVGHAPDPWRFPDWAYADQAGRFDGRWDDPDGTYRVMYASDTEFGAFVEVLADFRPDPEVAAALKNIVVEDENEASGPAPGEVPRSWIADRVVGRASVTGQFAQVGHSRSLTFLRRELASLLVRHNLEDLDGAAIRLRAPRAFTQQLSRFVYECTDDVSRPQFDGIHYLSRLGDDLENYALFELPQARDRVQDVRLTPVDLDDEGLQRAMEHLGLRWFADITGGDQPVPAPDSPT